MATKVIRIDAEVLAELTRLAQDWGMQFKTPNEVLRRALGLPPSKDS